MKKKLICFLALLLLLQIHLLAGTAGKDANYESRYIVDMPNAGMLTKGYYGINAQLISDGGLVLEFLAAPFSFLSLGISYGGYGVIGNGDIDFQHLPGFEIKARIMDEEKLFPAIALGFNSQGHGLYFADKKRFEQMAPGFYIAASKSFNWDLGELSLHAGINYCIEHKGDRGINLYGGLEQALGKYFSVYFEVNPNINDGDSEIYPDLPIMLNTAIRASIFKSLTFEMLFRDLLTNSSYSERINRYIGIGFVNKF